MTTEQLIERCGVSYMILTSANRILRNTMWQGFLNVVNHFMGSVRERNTSGNDWTNYDTWMAED